MAFSLNGVKEVEAGGLGLGDYSVVPPPNCLSSRPFQRGVKKTRLS